MLVVVIIVAVVAVALVIVGGFKIKNIKKHVQDTLEEIDLDAAAVELILTEADCVYSSDEGNADVNRIAKKLDDIRQCIIMINNYRKQYPNLENYIKQYVKGCTEASTWAEYEKQIVDKYLYEESSENIADKMMKEVTYSSEEEMQQRRLVVEEVHHLTTETSYEICGTITNKMKKPLVVYR